MKLTKDKVLEHKIPYVSVYGWDEYNLGSLISNLNIKLKKYRVQLIFIESADDGLQQTHTVAILPLDAIIK